MSKIKKKYLDFEVYEKSEITTISGDIVAQIPITPGLPSDENLVGYWSFDEGRGTTAADSSGNGNDGTIHGNPTWVDGVSGKALSFDQSITYQYVSLPDDIVDVSSDTFTVCLWAKWDSGSLTTRTRMMGIVGTYGLQISKMDTDEIGARIDDGTGIEVDRQNTPHIWQDSEYVFVVVIVDSGSVSHIYVNANDGTLSSTTHWSGTAVSSIGTGDGSQNYSWFGLLDEVRIYNRALTASEVKALYLQPGGTKSLQKALNSLQSDGSIPITADWDVDGANTLFIDKTNGRVGVRTATPGDELEVAGTISGTNGLFKNTYVGEVGTGFAGFCYEGNDNYNDYALLQGSDGTTYINAVNLKSISLRINNSEKLQILSTGVRVSNGVFVLPNGTSINEFSTDTTLSGNSDNAVPTEKAVKTYVDGLVGSVGGSSPTNVPYGYSMGGSKSSTYFSTIDRITFPFDSGTASHVGNLSGSHYVSAGCNSSDYGYNMGGNSSSTIDRITFPFDSGTASHVGNLSGPRYVSDGCNSSNYGYSMGGYSPYLSTIDRITFPFDSGPASHVGDLSGSRNYPAGCNSSNYGYSMGGGASVDFTIIDRITFPFDSGTASHVGNLSGAVSESGGCNSSNYGYNIGGAAISTLDRIAFPFDSGIASQVGNLSGTQFDPVGCNSSNYGYCMGGIRSSTYFSIIDRIAFPFDSGTASHVGNLSGTRYSSAGCDGTDFVSLFV